MIRYYKNNLYDLTHSTSSVWRKWIVIGIILMFELVYINAEKCCYSTASSLKQAPNIYQLNITASHVNSKKGNNKYATAISFQEGYSIIGEPYSPFNRLECYQVPDTGKILQYQCDSVDRAMFFVTFDLTVRFLPQSNASITASEVFVFGDKCQNVAFCTDLAAKNVSETADKISLGPLGTWPKYAVVIGGVILGLSVLIACYLVYKRNRPDDSYKDRSITPGTSNYDDKRLFSPNSLLRDEDLPPPSDEPPKNTLIQFGSAPERSKSVKNQHQHHQSSLTKSPTRKKKENKDRDHQEIEIYDNIKSDGDGRGSRVSEVIVDISSNNNGGYKSRKSKDRGNNNNINRMSDYSTSDMSKTISVHDNNSDVGGDLSDNNNNNNNNENKHLSSTSVRRKKSKSNSKSVNSGERESRHDSRHDSRRGDRRRSPNNNNSNKPRRSSTSRGAEENREGHRVDRATSRGRRSRKDSFSPSRNTSDLRKGPSVRTRQTDHDTAIKNKVSFSHDKDTGKNNNKTSRSDNNLDRKKSNKRKDLDSSGDTESDVPLGDKLPLAMLATKLPSSSRPTSWKSDDNNKVEEEDDDTTPLGRISSYSAGNTNSLGATSTSSRTHLMDAGKSPEDNNYDSILDEILAGTTEDGSNVNKEKKSEPEEVSIEK